MGPWGGQGLLEPEPVLPLSHQSGTWGVAVLGRAGLQPAAVAKPLPLLLLLLPVLLLLVDLGARCQPAWCLYKLCAHIQGTRSS